LVRLGLARNVSPARLIGQEDDVNPPDGLRTPWFVLAICGLFLVLLPVALIRHWRAKSQPYDYSLSGVIHRSRNLRKGHVRALPVMFAWWMVVCLTMGLMFLAPQYPPDVENPYYSWGIVVIFASALVAAVLYWLVVLFNRPSLIVAPHLRGERGLIESKRTEEPSRRQRAEKPTSSRRSTQRSERTLSFDVTAEGGLIEVGDRDAKEVPIWEPSTKSALSNGRVVLLAARPPRDGPVTVKVAADDDPPRDAHEAFAGRLDLPSGVVAVGNTLVGQLEEVDLSPARSVFLRVFVDSPESPSTITVLLDTRQAAPNVPSR
jgi:hypothetical protein